MWKALRLWICGLVLLAVAAPAALSQGEELVEIKLDKDLKITDFLDVISKSTGKPLLYDPNGQRIRGQALGAGFTHEIPKDRVFDTFRAILAFYELVLVPIGPRGYEIYLVIDSRSTNNFVKNKAVYVDHKDLEQYEDHDGLYISCAIPLTHIENLTTLRTALSTMVSPAGIGRVHEVPGSNSIIIMDFAPTVAAMAKLIKQMDVQPPGKALVLEFIELAYAYADDVAEIIGELVTAQRQAQVTQRRGQTTVRQQTPEPRILAYEPRNALVIAATEDDFQLIKSLVERFDEASPELSTVEVIRLNHVEAEDVADTLTQVLEGMGGALGGPQTGQPRRQGQRPTQPGVRRTSRSDEVEPQVVPDPVSNSIILAADRKTIVALKDILTQLDIPKDQVLIEATLISLTRTDDFQLGVELVGIDETGLTSSTASGFGVTNFGLSTFEDTNDDGIPDINIPTALSSPGGGLVAGIFRNGGIPVLLQAVQQLNNAQIMSMPSVVTYENSTATLTSQQEQPVGNQTELSSGSLTQAFEDYVQAGVVLTVSPHISADNYLRLDLELEVSSFTGDPPGAGLPSPRITNNLITTVALPNEYTVVMGGLISEEDSVSEIKVPILGDIPVLGYLFKNKTRKKIKRNLFIFVTPHILRQRGVSFDELHRQSWIAKMKADELIEAVEIHNSNFMRDPRFKTPDEAGMAALDISTLIDAGRFQEVPAERALLELQRLRQRTASK
ncbi:MAG: secretin N-terminal domain-containing protein [Planctomycetota bacterium]|jgi:general secretion pathway protein D